MLSASVAQKPTIAVSEGTKKATNSSVVAKRLGAASVGPKPPARVTAHASKASPATIRNGAAHASRNLIESLPFTTTYMFNSQKMAKPRNMAKGGSHCGIATFSMV